MQVELSEERVAPRRAGHLREPRTVPMGDFILSVVFLDGLFPSGVFNAR